jgi:hypothetical protein
MLGAGLGYSSNPELIPDATGDAAAGARLDGRCSFGDAKPFLVEASARGMAFDGGRGDRLEGHFAGFVPLVTYTATRLVEPHGPDLVGLHPRVVQGLTTKAVFYVLDVKDVDFREDALSSLDSRTRSHTVAVPFSLSAWFEREAAVSFFLYSWLEGESAGVTDYESETGLFVLSLAGPDLARAGFDPSWAGWTVDAALGRAPSLSLALGWRRMAEFEGPVADPSDEVTSFAGFLVGSLGPFAVALRRTPGASLVSNYQIDTSAELAYAAGAGRWLARAKFGRDEADRSWGPDVSLWKAALGLDVRLAREWSLKLDLGWQERSSTAPGEDYDVFTAFLGVTWGPRAPYP